MQGQVATFYAPGPFSVRSQGGDHPFYMAAFMVGGANYQGRGDAEFVNVVPAQQFQGHYLFFTDPSYPETNLVLVRARAKDGTFKDVTLDCAGTLSGWLPVSPANAYQYTRIDLSRYNFQPQNGCDNGLHQISSDGPFGLTVWGWGSTDTSPSGNGYNSIYCSYAYPAGAGVLRINQVQQLPPVQ
jgi:hypothetical protein